jgi:hypothetical protein
VIRHLPRQDGVQLVHGHAWALERARALHVGRRRYHHHRVHPLLAAGFEQERNVEHRDLLAPRLRLGQQPPFRLLHERMNDRLEAR